MADPILGLGPNLNAYRAALQQKTGHSQSQQMAHAARDVARTLSAAFNNIPFPVNTRLNKRERDILQLREAIEQMIEALSTAVKDGGFDGVDWPDSSGHLFTLPQDKTPVERQGDEVELSVRSRQFLNGSQEAMEAMERGLHPLEDSEAAKEIAWLAQAQVLHEAIIALNAQANIDPILAKRVLQLSTGNEIRAALNLRAQRLSSEEPTPDTEKGSEDQLPVEAFIEED